MTQFKKGDDVSWNTPQGKTHGEVTQKLTDKKKISGHEVKASENNPQYEVKSDKTGKKAAHKPESLDKE